ncbi:MAG: autotransporter domain-containing protein [Chthoniobacter sp.]|nr:autotransporter domain-containing protein [Chthoniobacter sp.]
MKTNRTSTSATKTKSRIPGRILSASIAALLAVAAVPQGARAANVTWNHGSALNNNWSNGGAVGNWFTSAAPANGDNVFFDNGAALNVANTNDIVGLSLNSITFNVGATNGTYTLSGNAITLGAGGLTNNTSGVTQTISLAGVTLGAGQTWDASAGSLAVTSTVNLNGQGLIVTGGSNTNISNAISGAGAGSTLTKNGTGILTLSGNAANTFAGLTSVNNGLLQLNNGLSDGAIVGNLTIGDNAGAAASAEVRWLQSAEVANTSVVTINADGKMNLNSFTETVGSISGVAGAQIDIGGGALTTGGDNTSTTFAGVISGGGNLSKNGTGTWTLTGANNYSATTFVNAGILEAGNNTALGNTAGNTLVNNGGTLRLLNGVNIGAEALGLVGAGVNAANGALAVAAGGTASYAGLITLNGNSTITANGGTLTLTGGIVKNGVTLTLGTATAGGGTINVNSVISGAAASSDLVVESLTTNLNAANTYNGPTTIRSSGGAGTGILNANVAGALPTAPRSAVTMDDSTSLGGSILNLNGGVGQVVASLTSPNSAIGLSSRINLNGNTLTIGTAAGTTTFFGQIGAAGDLGGIVKDGASTQILANNANGYIGNTVIQAGHLQIGNGTTGNLNGASAVTVNPGAFLDLNLGAVSNNFANAITNNGTVEGVNTSGSQSVSGVISGIGNFVQGLNGVTPTPGGTTVFANINTYQGGTRVTGASSNLIIGTAAAGATAGANIGSNTVVVDNGGGFRVANVAGGILNNNITNGIGGQGVVTLQSTSAITTLTGTLTNGAAGTLFLANQGPGTAILTNSGNTFTAGTLITGGTLQIGTSTQVGSVGTGVITVGTGGTLLIVNTVGNALAMNITNTAGGTGTVNVNSANNNTLSGVLSDGGGSILVLTQSGTGTTLLTGANTYTGATTVNAGVLQVGNNATGSINAASAVTVNNTGTLGINLVNTGVFGNAVTVNAGGLVNTNITAGTQTLSGVVTGAGALTQSGAGTTNLTANNTFTGPTTVTAGTLQVGTGGAGNLNAASVVTVTGGTLGINVAGGTGTFGNTVAVSAGALVNTNNAAGTQTLTNAITGAGALTQSGAGTSILTGTNTYSGATTVNAGVLQVGNGVTGTINPASAVAVAAGAALAVNLANNGTLGNAVAVTGTGAVNFIVATPNTNTAAGVISGTGVVNHNGTGTTNVSGPNTYTGLTTVNAGVLEVQNNTALGTAAAGTTVVGGATLRLANGIVLGAEALTLNGAGTGAANALGALTVTAGGTATVGGPITIASNSTINANGGTLNLNGVINKTSVVLTLAGGGTVNVNAAIQITGAPAGFNDDLVVNGTTSNLNAANSYLGPTFIRSVVAGDGTLNANVANALPTVNGRTSITMDDAGAGGSTLNIGGSAGFPLGANQAIASLAGASTSKVLLGANTLTIGFGTAPDTNGTAGASFAGVISGTGGILKNEGSTQIFAGNNTYTGPTNVQGGILQAGFLNTAFGVNSAVTVAGAANALELANFSETIGSLAGTANVKNTVNNGPGGAVLTISGTAGIAATYSGVISDTAGTPLALVLNDGSVGGTTVESFSGQSTYQGGTTLNAGRLDIDASSIAVGAIPSVNPVASGPVGTGTLTINGGTIGTSLAIGSNNAIGNNVQVNGDFAVAGANGNNDGVTFTGNTNLAGATTITTNSGFLDFSGTITGGGGLTLAGATFTYIGSSSIGGVPGILGQVDASNTYAGTTTVQSGFVLLGKNSGAIAIPGNLVVDAGATVQVDSFVPNTVGLGTTANQIATTSNVTVNGTLDLSGINQTINGLTGAGQVRLDDVNGGNVGTAAIFTVGSGNFGGSIVDSNKGGQLTKNTAGTLTLTGASTYTGNTNINLGSLVVNGSLKSANILVNPLGTLVGFGKTSGNVTNSGTFRPGSNTTQPGTFTIGGNYTQTASGNLVIEIAGKGASDHDLVKVAGKANLNGNLRIVNVNGTRLKVGDKITFISAAGGVSGEFANVNNDFEITDRILTADVHYHTTSVSLELQQGSFGDFAKFKGATPNQRSVAHALDKVAFNTEEGKLIGFLNNEPLGNLLHDFDLIAAEELQAIYTIGFAQANVQTSNLSRRLDDIRSGSAGFSASGYSATGMEPQYSSNYLAPNGGLAGPGGKMSKEMRPPVDNRVGVFFTGSGEFTDVGKTSNASGYNLATAGFTLGMDYRVNENFAIGVNLGYSRTNADLFGNGKVNVDGMKLGLYATYFRQGFYVDALAQGGYNTYDTRRSALQGSATGSTDGTEFNAHLAVGYDWHRGGLTVGPMASVQYTRVGFDSFREDGSLAPLTYGSQSGDSLRTALGAKASYEIQAGSVIIKPEVRAAWQHEFADNALAIDARFSNGGGNTFNVQGAEIGADSLLLGAGVAVLWNERTSTYVYYDGEIGRSNYESNNVSGGVRVEF